MGRYLVKCDECKKTIKTTDKQHESFMGGHCVQCKKQINKKNWGYFD